MLLTIVVAEYLRRITTKAFVLTTLLGPLAVIGIMGGAAAAVHFSVESESTRARSIAVLDESGRILPRLREQDSAVFQVAAVSGPLEAAKQKVIDGEAEVLLVLPGELAEAAGSTEAFAFVDRQQGIAVARDLRRFVLDTVRDVRLSRHNLPAEVLETMDETLSLTTVTLGAEGEEHSSELAVVVGLAIAVLILIVMAVYGGLVMQAVMEEKTTRMAEILVATVRPFDLLMGKILAIAGMAATQLVVWLAMLAVVGVAAAQMVPAEDLVEFGVAVPVGESAAEVTFPSIRLDVLFVVLLMLPLGYLINASVFGALGSLYETPQEAQMAVTIAMAPMIAAVVMVQTAGIAPTGAMVAFGAWFPFTAPAMLPTRMLVTDVPTWQVALSVATCAASALGIVWLAGRVFRGSLLTYGKKVGIRDIWLVLRD